MLTVDAIYVMWATSGKLLFGYCGLQFNLCFVQQITVEDPCQEHLISRTADQPPTVGGWRQMGVAGVLLNDRMIWLFDGTQIISKDNELITFVSNTAAYSHTPKANVTLLQNFDIVALGKQHPHSE